MGKGKNRRKNFPSYYSKDSSASGSNADLEYLGQANSNGSGAYIDHRRYDDLANLHSSPARSRRRSSMMTPRYIRHGQISNQKVNDKTTPQQSPESARKVPLTNKNLSSFMSERSRSASEEPSQSGVLVDMDKFATEQSRIAQLQTWIDDESKRNGLENKNGNHDGEVQDETSSSLNSLEFGESNPSSEHSGDSTSLDDVCFPDYYDQLDPDGNKIDSLKWPDLKILEEFIKEEFNEYRRSNDHSEGEELNVNFPEADSVASPRTKRSFDYSNVRESTPLLGNTQINEVESLDSVNNSLRVRPTPIQPWEKSKNNIPTILNNPNTKGNAQGNTQGTNVRSQNGDVAESKCRFTYFREDLEKTIHSPTIGGLISDESFVKKINQDKGSGKSGSDNDIIHKGLKELFEPSVLVKQNNVTKRSSSASIKNQASNNVANANSLMDQQSSSLQPLSALVNQSSRGTATPIEPAMSVADSTYDSNVVPYWLDVSNPTEEEMKVLSKTFGIHPLTTEDIFLGETREKVELFKSYYFICFTSFDIVYERRKQRKRENDKKMSKLQDMFEDSDHRSLFGNSDRKSKLWKLIKRIGFSTEQNNHRSSTVFPNSRESTSLKSKGKKIRDGELSPLNMYMIVFKDAIITFHFAPTPHPINVRRRSRLLREYLTVSSDWLCYALIDDVTDSFAPMIDSIEEEVNSIEDTILKMHSGQSDSEDESDDESSEGEVEDRQPKDVFYRRKRSKSVVETKFHKVRGGSSVSGTRSTYTSLRSTRSTDSKIIGWKRKGDMLRRIGECRKRVMSVLRLLGSKADVIKGFSKRFNENVDGRSNKMEVAMYLGDIQDHIVTMVQSLNHYEKLLARFHSNYLAQINIDMTQVNNDTNDVLGKITILGTIVLPINVVTGLWGMNCIVPGQDYDGLAWFWSIICGMVLFSFCAYHYAKKVTGL